MLINVFVDKIYLYDDHFTIYLNNSKKGTNTSKKKKSGFVNREAMQNGRLSSPAFVLTIKYKLNILEYIQMTKL